MSPALSRELADLMTLGQATPVERQALIDASAGSDIKTVGDMSAKARGIVADLRVRKEENRP